MTTRADPAGLAEASLGNGRETTISCG